MASKYKVGDEVYVPAELTENGAVATYAITRRRVTGLKDGGRSVYVDGGTGAIGTRRVHPANLGVTVLRIGDLKTEAALLDPLAKSVLQYLRLLLPEDETVRSVSVRTTIELREWWNINGAAHTHCVLIGHGDPAGIRFLDQPALVSGFDLGTLLSGAAPKDAKPVSFLSLSCLTGRTQFGNGFSSTDVCANFVAPMQSVHGAGASQYMQTFFGHHLLDGIEILPAHRRANRSTTAGSSFRFFRDGAWIKDAASAAAP